MNVPLDVKEFFDALADTSEEGRLAGRIAGLIAATAAGDHSTAASFQQAVALIRAYGGKRAAHARPETGAASFR